MTLAVLGSYVPPSEPAHTAAVHALQAIVENNVAEHPFHCEDSPEYHQMVGAMQIISRMQIREDHDLLEEALIACATHLECADDVCVANTLRHIESERQHMLQQAA